jgi:hypothetical protein
VVARTAALCAIELLIAVLLAVQVFADRPPPAPPVAPAGAGDAPRPAHATATAAPAAAPAPQPAPAAASAREAPRERAAARWRDGDPVGVLLTGTVRGSDGKPADVSLSAKLDKSLVSASATADGSYALVGLRPGEWTVTLRGTGFVEATATVAITDDAVQHRDFTVDPSFPVRVLIVTADGQDGTFALRKALPWFGDFNVAGKREPFPERLAPTDYGAVFVGDATFDRQMNPKDGFAGTLHCKTLPAHVALLQRHLVLQQQVVQPATTEVKFTVDIDALKALAASATVRVLDADSGAPLVDARVSLDTSNRGGMGHKVDADGRAVLEGLSPGLLRCNITAKDRETMYTTVRVEPGQRLDLGDVRLGAALTLRGTVLDADGRPATASLSWTELKWRTRATAAFASNRSARTEADGTFSLWGTGRGAIAVAARDQQGNVAMGVFDNPPATPVVLQLSRPCECVVVRPADPTRTFTLTLFDAARRPVTGREIGPRSPKSTVQLPPGEYAYEVHDADERLLQSGSLTLGATPCTLEIR